MNIILCLKLAGVSHIGLLAAGGLMPRAVQLGSNLSSLPLFVRQLFWSYYCFIGLCLAAFGVGTFFLAETLVSGQILGRSVCGFLAVFWGIRLALGILVFELRPYLTSTWKRMGLVAINLVFAFLTAVYAFAALRGNE